MFPCRAVPAARPEQELGAESPNKALGLGGSPPDLLVPHIGVNIGVDIGVLGPYPALLGLGGCVGIFSLGEGARGAERNPLEKSQQ